jgi:hypothetical protein
MSETDLSQEQREHRAGVEFAIEEGELPNLHYAGPRVAGPGNYILISAPVTLDWEPIAGGSPTLELYVDAANLDDAQRRAEAVYAEMRKEGGLPP